jgi:hypothetical protein
LVAWVVGWLGGWVVFIGGWLGGFESVKGGGLVDDALWGWVGDRAGGSTRPLKTLRPITQGPGGHARPPGSRAACPPPQGPQQPCPAAPPPPKPCRRGDGNGHTTTAGTAPQNPAPLSPPQITDLRSHVVDEQPRVGLGPAPRIKRLPHLWLVGGGGGGGAVGAGGGGGRVVGTALVAAAAFARLRPLVCASDWSRTDRALL